MTSAAHRRLIRRRVLSNLSASSPPRQMKKKKPKKSPQSISKTSPKASPPAKSTPSKSEVKDLAPYSPSIVSDAQISSPVEEVAQQSLVGSDLVANTGSASSVETVIVDSSADPSSQVPKAPSVQSELRYGTLPSSSPC